MSKIIVLDPGHGGSDPGAVGNGIKEKDLNLTISLSTREELSKYDCSVKMSRTKDVYVALSARPPLGKGADLFVSQHNNAYSSSAARGFETFANSGNVMAPTLGYRDTIHDAIYPYLRSLGVPNRGKKRHNHYITGKPPCPTVLVEYMFVTSPADAALLKKSAVLKEMGKLTAQGIVKALGLKKKAAAPAPKPSPKLPNITRTIAIYVNDKKVDEVGFLIDNATFIRIAYLIELVGGKVTGKGDRVEIWLPDKVDSGAVAALEAEVASLKRVISEARKVLG